MTAVNAPAARIYARLAADGQHPRYAGNLLGTTVINARHRGRLGSFDVYVAPDGRWTHNVARVAHWATEAGEQERAQYART